MSNYFLYASSMDTLRLNTKSIDTIKTQRINDTLYVKSKIFESDKGFFSRNEGTILGSFLAALVSLFSILITMIIRNKKEKEKEEKVKEEKVKVYCGLLHSIYHEMKGHQRLLEMDWKSLEIIRDITIEKDKPVIEGSMIEKINTDFINECRLKILEFENYNTDLLPLISEYINRINNLNTVLDVKPKLDSIVSLNLPFRESVLEYFNEIKRYIDSIESGIIKVNDLIKEEIEKFPHSEVTNDN